MTCLIRKKLIQIIQLWEIVRRFTMLKKQVVLNKLMTKSMKSFVLMLISNAKFIGGIPMLMKKHLSHEIFPCVIFCILWRMRRWSFGIGIVRWNWTLLWRAVGVQWYIDGQQFTTEPVDIFMINANQIHAVTATRRNKDEWFFTRAKVFVVRTFTAVYRAPY